MKLTKVSNSLYAEVISAPKPPSAARSLSPMIHADGSFVAEEDITRLNAGSTIDVMLNDYEIEYE